MKEFEIKSIDSSLKIKMIGKNNEILVLGSWESNFVEILREYPVKSIIKLMRLKEEECLSFFEEEKEKYKSYALEILSEKWYSRETGEKFSLKDYECEFITGYPSFQKVKNEIKKNRYTIRILCEIIEHFTNDYSEFYKKN